MKKEYLVKIFVLYIILLFICGGVASAFNKKYESKPLNIGNWFYVGGSGEGNYTRIQDAIDNASDGDTVFVFDDSAPYYEHNITIRKSINLIGENKENTIIDATNNYYSLKILQTNYVTIGNFKIINAETGIESRLTEGCIIKDNIITSCTGPGIFHQGSYLNFTNNIISNTTLFGLIVHGIGNNISYNNITNNGGGIYLGDISSNNFISHNNIISNNRTGIKLYFSDDNTIKYNIISRNEFGISLSGSGNVFNGNHITLNKNVGMTIWQNISNFNTIIKNNFISNGREAYLERTPFNLWRQNYWNEPRILPKLIIGYIFLFNGSCWIPWFNIDWHPAKEPYDIPKLEYNLN